MKISAYFKTWHYASAPPQPVKIRIIQTIPGKTARTVPASPIHAQPTVPRKKIGRPSVRPRPAHAATTKASSPSYSYQDLVPTGKDLIELNGQPSPGHAKAVAASKNELPVTPDVHVSKTLERIGWSVYQLMDVPPSLNKFTTLGLDPRSQTAQLLETLQLPSLRIYLSTKAVGATAELPPVVVRTQSRKIWIDLLHKAEVSEMWQLLAAQNGASKA